ncbi:MAG: hypothetical protein IPO21_02235 [Bacteroidales bacterium]|nr:hypothetical protein [Bacteroidales bacterium]
MIKKIIISVITSLLFASFAFSQDEDKLSFGAKVMIGGRYDDVRMCGI